MRDMRIEYIYNKVKEFKNNIYDNMKYFEDAGFSKQTLVLAFSEQEELDKFTGEIDNVIETLEDIMEDNLASPYIVEEDKEILGFDD